MKISYRKLSQYFVIFTIALLFGGCQPKVYLMPTPIALNSDSQVFDFSENNKDENLLYTLYATNREPSGTSAESSTYSIEPSDSLRLGYVVHRVGDEDMSWDDLQEESLTQERSKKLLIAEFGSREMARYDMNDNMTQALDRADGFFDRINQALEKAFNKELLIYVHGANCNFYRATAQGAQYFHFTGHNSVVLTFSWPSAESFLKYKIDVAHARETVPAFAHLIEILARKTDAEHINILAYSAGAQIAVPGLAYVRELYPDLEADELKKRLRIGEVYLAAPDSDFVPFIESYMSFKDIVDRTTLNLNHDDNVLRLSAIQNGVSRLGRPDTDELSEEEGQALLDALESEALDLLNVGDSEALELKGDHGSWYTHPWVSNDLLLMMLFRASPKERGLLEYRLENGVTGYYFPEDYDRRVQEILAQER